MDATQIVCKACGHAAKIHTEYNLAEEPQCFGIGLDADLILAPCSCHAPRFITVDFTHVEVDPLTQIVLV